MAVIGEEVDVELVSTNVLDDNPLAAGYFLATSRTSSYYIDTEDRGKLYSTGRNSHGQLGLEEPTARLNFTYTGVEGVESIHPMLQAVLILKADGTVWGAGSNWEGELGLGTSLNTTSTFMKIPISNVSKLFTYGDGHSAIALKTDGSLWATGSNDGGVLGLGSNVSYAYNFTEINIADVIDVSIGYRHTILQTSTGKVYSTGNNTYNQLLIEDIISRDTFTEVSGFGVRRKIICGRDNTFVLNVDLTLWVIGNNLGGELGLGTTTNVTTLTTTGVGSVIDVVTGVNGSDIHGFSRLILSDGLVYATGYNLNGELGLGDTTDRTSFTTTTLYAQHITYNMILDTLGNILSTGLNNFGQLGLGDIINRSSFTDTGEDMAYASLTVTYEDGQILQSGGLRYSVSTIGEPSSSFFNLVYVSETNPYLPFDGTNITPAIFTSPMNYVVKGLEEFNSFTLAKVLASSITYSFTLPLGDATYDQWLDGVEVANGGNGIVKLETIAIDCKRDRNSILSLYPTTVVYYAGRQMPSESTVSIELTHDNDIQLGDFTFNNSINAGLTKLNFTHSIQDYNDYTPDAFGQIPKAIKAIVTKFNITVDVLLENYDDTVSFDESIAGKNVTIDGSDSGGEVSDSLTVFRSLTRRVRITNVSSKPAVKDGELWRMAGVTMTALEIV